MIRTVLTTYNLSVHVAHRQDVLLVLASSKSSYSCRPWVAICKGGRPRWIGTAPNCAARSPTTETSCDANHAIDPGCFRNQNWRRTGSSHTFQPDQKEEAKLLITPRLAVAAKGKYCCTSSSRELSLFSAGVSSLSELRPCLISAGFDAVGNPGYCSSL